MMTTDLCLFDLDGTLIKNFLDEVPCPGCGGGGHGPDQAYGPDVWQSKCPACNGRGTKLIQREPYGHFEVLPRTREVLRTLADAGIALGICTNQTGVAFGYQTRAQVLGKIADVLNEIDVIMSVQVAFHHPAGRAPFNDPAFFDLRKPAPGMILAQMEAHGVDADHTTYVGDLPTDEQAAKNAGVSFVWADEFFGRR